MARFGLRRPTPAELDSQLEAIWNEHRLNSEDLSDPGRMTDLLKKHLAPVSSRRARRSACCPQPQ